MSAACREGETDIGSDLNLVRVFHLIFDRVLDRQELAARVV